MHGLLAIGLTTAVLAAPVPPLARAPADAPQQAVNPMDWDDLPDLDPRRLRLSAGMSLRHAMLHSPGGNAPGIGVSLALEHRRSELALSAWVHSGLAAQDANGRNTGVSHGSVRASIRAAPFRGSPRVMLEAGTQIGWAGAWSWCTQSAGCGFVPARMTYGAVLGTMVLFRPGPGSMAAGFDLALEGPKAPAAVYSIPVTLQARFEAGWGGITW